MISSPVTPSQVSPRQQRALDFIGALERLDAGGLARLRRNAGRTLAEATDAHRTFFQAAPYRLKEWDEQTYFMIATLFALTKKEDRISDRRSLGATFRHVRGATQGERANSLDRRFQALINSDREQLPFRLRQLVRLAKSNGQRIDFAKLLTDIGLWEIEDKPVQVRWSRDYYVGAPNSMPTP